MTKNMKHEKEMWNEIEDLGWGKDFDYKRINNFLLNNDILNSIRLKEFVHQKHSELLQAIEKYEVTNGKKFEFTVSLDGFSDVTWHIVGLGLKEWKKAIENPKLVEKRYNATYKTSEGYAESFLYCFQNLYNMIDYD